MLVKYDEGLLQISNAIRQYYGLEIYHQADKAVYQWLDEHQFKTLIVLMIDGMGARNLKQHLSKDHFLLKHMHKEVPTVFPPTTTAATTAFLTGKSPKETAWLGWSQYFKEVDDTVVLFRNESLYDRTKYPNLSYHTLPITPIFSQLSANGITVKTINPSWDVDGTDDLAEFIDKILQAASTKTGFIYGYFDQLDAMMHKYGPSSEKVAKMLELIDQKLAYLAQKLDKDCGLLIVADHGQVDVQAKCIDDYPDILACLKRKPSLEARCISFDVKDDQHANFEKAFRKHFNEDFALLSHEEAIRMNLFGINEAHERFADFVGDYVAIGCTDVSLFPYKRNDKGDHAGSKEKEIMIPLITVPKMEHKK
ncbi:MAG: alkaline phosphatase family protein [Erysipelotrichaceae bacterium]|nr:alkaline phosphatase family protein [Erysipelotrichaceae bacterium]MDY5251541.1 alkaline phosphatase family protein [Erysipelotrichaceae bacterium]